MKVEPGEPDVLNAGVTELVSESLSADHPAAWHTRKAQQQGSFRHMQEPGIPGKQLAGAADSSAGSVDASHQHGCGQGRSAVIRWLFAGCGLVFTGLAVLGLVLPGLPTTPFLLLAVALFARSSPRLHSLLLNSRLLGPYLRDWQRYRAIRGRVRNTAVIAVVAGLSITLLSTAVPNWLKVTVLAAGLMGLLVIFRLPLLEQRASSGSETPCSDKSAPIGSDRSAEMKNE